MGIDNRFDILAGLGVQKMTHEELFKALDRIFEEELKTFEAKNKIFEEEIVKKEHNNRSDEAWDYQNESDSHRCDWR